MVSSPTDGHSRVNGFWAGSDLSSLELLTLHSFTAHGHQFHLWVYDTPTTSLPEGVILRDANEIIPSDKMYRRRHHDPDYGIGRGSLGSPFSDLFRFELLYREGGWWVDMDVTCLKPFAVSAPYYFRAHPVLPMIGNIMKVPKGSELMDRVRREVAECCDADTLDWLLPNRILNSHVKNLDLSSFIVEADGPPDWWESIQPLIFGRRRSESDWSYIHWMNEEWRSRGISKDLFFDGTTLGRLARRYGLTTRRPSVRERLRIYFG